MTDIDEALKLLKASFDEFENLDKTEQKSLLEAVDELTEIVDVAKKRATDAKYREQRVRNEQRRAREKVRKEKIPTWCREHLVPGMIVKVKAASFYRFRKIEKVGTDPTKWGADTLTGRHCSFRRVRDPATKEITWNLDYGDYITDHIFTNVQAVVTDYAENGDPVITPIMELIEQKDY